MCYEWLWTKIRSNSFNHSKRRLNSSYLWRRPCTFSWHLWRSASTEIGGSWLLDSRLRQQGRREDFFGLQWPLFLVVHGGDNGVVSNFLYFHLMKTSWKVCKLLTETLLPFMQVNLSSWKTTKINGREVLQSLISKLDSKSPKNEELRKCNSSNIFSHLDIFLTQTKIRVENVFHILLEKLSFQNG